MPTDPVQRARELVSKLTLEEKAALLSGASTWTTTAIERLGIPSLWLADGPHGLRKAPAPNEVGAGTAVPATCFPTASALACAWNEALTSRVGEAIGREARAHGVDVVLGPGVNLQRSPLGGRNFEYLGEDPVLSGRLAAAFIEGVQAQGVGACIKHFAANEQETERMSCSSEVDERTLRELYLRPFELAIERARPWSVMSAYNRVNGVFASEHRWLLSTVLREEWGFDGFVVSDWGAVDDRAAGVAAGLHLEMPSSGPLGPGDVVAAVRTGRLDEQRLDDVTAELLTGVLRAADARAATPAPAVDADAHHDAHHELAREVAAECLVLLRNEADTLPLDLSTAQTVAVIGRFARQPRIQGGGSSQVVPTRTTSAWEALAEIAAGVPGLALRHAEGTGANHEADADALAEACRTAAAADIALVFVGLPLLHEVEGVDRTHLALPPSHDALIEAVADVQPKLVVVVTAGAPVAMPWLARTRAVLLGGLLGQAGGGAVADVLTGRVAPSGKLASSWPVRLEDAPSYLHFPGEAGAVRYGEGVFMGYRGHDALGTAPLFPFGHGLSTTSFAYHDLRVSASRIRDDQGVTVTCRVRNTGTRAGREIVQLYVGDLAARVRRPPRELAAFAKLALEPGEEQELQFALDRRAFAFWDPTRHAWTVEDGAFEIALGASSRDLRLRTRIDVTAGTPIRARFDRHTPLARWLADPQARAAIEASAGPLLRAFGLLPPAPGGPAPPSDDDERFATLRAMILGLPIGKLGGFTRGAFSREQLTQWIAEANATAAEDAEPEIGAGSASVR
ncbi:MAG: glycoside hydrolase family 3 C-terminal domain-containing protein [Myxococcota bacterium]|nr:glycoside hydrolase family 3 C-terminal domain-containing protein [Myxococcota bacterium]